MPKILCVSDQVDPLIYDSRIKERFGNTDFVIAAGDLPMEYLDFIQESLKKPLFFVFGSHFLKAFTHYHPKLFCRKKNTFKSENAEYIGFKTINAGSILIAGVSGIKSETKNLSCFTEGKMRLNLLKMIPALLLNKLKYGRYLDILVTHFPPNAEKCGITDGESGIGFDCLARFIKNFKPKYVIHGAIHLYGEDEKRILYCGDTQIINSYSRYLLEF